MRVRADALEVSHDDVCVEVVLVRDARMPDDRFGHVVALLSCELFAAAWARQRVTHLEVRAVGDASHLRATAACQGTITGGMTNSRAIRAFCNAFGGPRARVEKTLPHAAVRNPAAAARTMSASRSGARAARSSRTPNTGYQAA